MVDIPTIEPFQFIRSTAFSERVQLANKLNEIIDAVNSIGDLPDLESQITEINSKISELEESIGNTDTSLADLENQVNGLISEVNTTIKQSISALESEVDGIDTRLTTAEGTLSEHGREIDGLLKEVIDGVAMTSNPHGTIQVQINHEDGTNDISAPIDLGLVEEGGIILRSGTTDRSFKLIVNLTDGTSWQTNDFVIPEGGGTDVSVTNISIAQGTASNMIQVKIGLSDGSTISSNDWTVVTPSEFSALGTRVTTAEGKITAQAGEISALGTRMTTAENNITKNTGDITKNTGDISDLETRVQALENSPGFTLQPATATTLGGVKIGSGITVQADGTIAVDMTKINTAAVASTVMFTADASKVTLHADSVAGSEFTKDIPQASQGGAGTIDQESYAKIAANETAISELEADVAALAPSVSVNEALSPPTITVGINGKEATANLPSSGGGGWKRYTLDNLPTDFSTSSIVMFELITQIRILSPWPESWNDPVTFELKKSLTTASMQTTSVMKCYSGSFGATAPNIRSDAGNVVAMGAIAISVTNIDKLNERNTTNQFGELIASMFNGAGGTAKSVTLTWSNISDYIVAIWRYEDS